MPEFLWRTRIQLAETPSPELSKRNRGRTGSKSTASIRRRMEVPTRPCRQTLISHRRRITTSSVHRRTESKSSPPRRDKAPPPELDGKQTLTLGKILPKLYTSARRFRSSPSSRSPERSPEKKGSGGIAAGNGNRLAVALSSALYCRRGKEDASKQ